MLILIWVAPTLPEGTASITGYDVQYRAQGESDWIVHNFDSDARETTITDLASNTYYDAQVQAVNVEGSRPWSPTSSANDYRGGVDCRLQRHNIHSGRGERIHHRGDGHPNC